MKPPVPLPTAAPFLTIFTPTYRRPTALACNLRSVGRQTAHDDLEQIVLPDHVGHGIGGGLFGRLKWYGEMARGRYVHVLQDDDFMPDDKVVEYLRLEAEQRGEPDVFVVNVEKDGHTYPKNGGRDEGDVDMACFVMRRDVWLAHLADYTERYAGDWDHYQAMRLAGREFVPTRLVFAAGSNRNGRPEVDYR